MPPAVDESFAGADVVFVGTVTDLRFDGRLASFHVEEVWKGEVSEVASVTGGPTPAQLATGVSTSVDRTYEQGARYLVVPHAVYDGVFADNACSATALMTAELGLLRPESAQEPLSSPERPSAGSSLAWTVGGAAVLVALLGVMVAVLKRKRLSEPATAQAQT